MQTAVEQLMIDLYEKGHLRGDGSKLDGLLEKYKEVFKQQIIDAHLIGLIRSLEMEATKQATEYYNETYGSKGSDKEEQKKLITEIMNEDAKDGLYYTSSQKEISDEEIEKAWSIVETTHVDKWVSFKSMFIEGAKWYREQLKKKI